MKALLFPGQGSQIVGMGQEFYNNFDIVKKLFSEADEKLKFKISKLILEGPSSDLKLTKNTQPAILTVSYSIYSVLIKEFNFDLKDIKYFAGHSLGEYSALLCAGSLSFSDSLFLLHERGKAMQAAVPIGEGGMLAILGLSIIEIENYISQIKNSGVCELANDNSEGQIIVSGNIKSINKLNENLKRDKKKSILLPVSAPFHCSLMKKAADEMKDKIDSIKFTDPNPKIISNVKATPESNSKIIKNLLVEQICSKVRWRESILYMIKNDINEFIEIGPGKVLSGLVKRISKDVKTTSLNSVKDITNVINEL
jgi:[acyl-carrier-protein] S-malonyltransferase|tara:strand:- start:1240 stop:2172 length:933 start_codon:yes stop_codon:yes gene_type:complete